MRKISNIPDLKSVISTAVQKTPTLDMHTHCFSPRFENLLLFGPDELITYHYLVAEVLRQNPVPYLTFWNMSKQQQADFIWENLFIKHSPISESCRGVLTVFKKLEIDVKPRDLNKIRNYFKNVKKEDYINTVFKKSNVSSIVMTNDPFDEEERRIWIAKGKEKDARFIPSLRLDCILNRWEQAYRILSGLGYRVKKTINDGTIKQIKNFLEEWIQRTNPVYAAASLPPAFKFPEKSIRCGILEECILPVCRKNNIPFAMMIGVKKLVNPNLKLAGDSVGRSSIESVEAICLKHPENKFLLTMLAREDQHGCCVAARKFNNLHIFGCWWFLNNPSIIEEMTRTRIELLGTSFTFQHSDARIIDQLLYKWEHSKIILEKVLSDKYQDLMKTGWVLTEAQIKKDVEELLGETFKRFVKN